MTPTDESAVSASATNSNATSDSDIIRVAHELAKTADLSVVETQIPSPHSVGEDHAPEWPNEEEAYWAVEAPTGKDPVTVLVDSNGSVRGVVPGDGVILQDASGTPHAVGRVTQMSVREGKVRVLIEGVRPIEMSS